MSDPTAKVEISGYYDDPVFGWVLSGHVGDLWDQVSILATQNHGTIAPSDAGKGLATGSVCDTIDGVNGVVSAHATYGFSTEGQHDVFVSGIKILNKRTAEAGRRVTMKLNGQPIVA